MARQITSLRVFVASPSDVIDERVQLEQIIRDLNSILGEKLGLRFDLVKWETNTYPSVGEDVQSVINQQIGDDYDIFMGILWKRFGTPTAREESGTAEEFNRAHQRIVENPESIRVMVYFNESPIALDELDEVEQYKQVLTFKKGLGKQGVYYWAYKKPEDFRMYANLHLSRVMNDFGKTWGIKPESDDAVKAKNEPKSVNTVMAKTGSEAKSRLAEDVTQDLESEEGFLDLVISSIDNMGLANESTLRLASLMQELATETGTITDEINQLSKPINPNEARPLINKQADLYENFAQRAEAELLILSEKFRSGIYSYTRSAQIITDFQSVDRQLVASSLAALTNIKEAVSTARGKMIELRAIVYAVPRMTTKLNHAKRRLIGILDRIIEELEAEENLSVEGIKIVMDVLKSIDGI